MAIDSYTNSNDELEGCGEFLATTSSQIVEKYKLSDEALHSFQEGMDCFRTGEPAVAIERLSRSTELAPNFAPGRVFLGLGLAMTHDIYPAIDNLELAIQLEPEGFAARYFLSQLYFKLRVPQKGYEAAAEALKCVTLPRQRKMLTELLKEENARKRNGISRPWFNKPFGKRDAWFAAGGMAAAVLAVILHWH